MPPAAPTRLHLGCGRTPLAGWVNLDRRPGPGVDVVADLDRCAGTPLPFADDSVDEFLGSHVLEHIRDPLPLFQELHRVARPGARATFLVPYGSSDDAFEDPTHVRQFFRHSFGYFSQPFYWRADYGYRGDWQPELVRLKVSRRRYGGRGAGEVLEEVERLRNVVLEMTAVLVAVKPIRSPARELQSAPRVELTLTDP
jgi:SAM-dependent methyltransferase